MSWAAKVRWGLALALGCACLGRAQSHTVAEQYLFQSINEERAAAGLRALQWSSSLTDAAQFHAGRMRAAGTISHQFSGEADVASRASRYGAKFSHIAENVATSPSVIHMHTALMHSPHHRENILDPQVTSIGIAVTASGNQLWGVEDFANDVGALTLEQQEQQVESLLEAIEAPHVGVSQEARDTCAKPSGYVGSRPAFVMRFSASDLNKLPSQLTARLSQGGVREVAVGACTARQSDFATYSVAVVLYR